MPPNFFETPLTSSTVPVALSGIRNEGSGKPWWILRWLMAAASSDAGQNRRCSVAQIPTRPAGEYSTKATKISPNQSSQFGVQIENSSRNRMKNSAPSAGPSRLRMPPITTIASSSPENGTDTASAETR